MKNYHRQDLLNLAYEMGVTIRSDNDLIQFECEMILNGDLELPDLEGVDIRDSMMQQKLSDQQEEQAKLIRDIHSALFKSSINGKTMSEEDKIKLTKASIILKAKKR